MIKVNLISLVILAMTMVDANAQTRVFGTIDHVTRNCDIRTSGVTVLRCVGRSHNSNDQSRMQMATLIFKCSMNKLSMSLGHAAVVDEVRVYTFEDNQSQVERNDGHIRVSKVRTGFTDSRSAAPRWIYLNVTRPVSIESLNFSLNGGEVEGEFQFDASDRRLFLMYFAMCPFGMSMTSQ